MPSRQEVPVSSRFDDVRPTWKVLSMADYKIGDTQFKQHIGLHAPDDFTEFVAGYVTQAAPSTINLIIKTRDAQGNRNPHFEGDRRAHLLVDRIFEELRSENDIEIDRLRFSWEIPSRKRPYSDNFMQYRAAKEAALAEGATKEEARRLAVMKTWTGVMIGERHNLTVPSDIYEERRFGKLGKLVGVSGLLLQP